MNAIDKLKSDLERYHKALTQIRCDYVASSIAHQTADAALNPPPVPPVTVGEILVALRNKNRGGGALHSVRFYSDESGHLYNEGKQFYAAFYSLREALDILNNV